MPGGVGGGRLPVPLSRLASDIIIHKSIQQKQDISRVWRGQLYFVILQYISHKLSFLCRIFANTEEALKGICGSGDRDH